MALVGFAFGSFGDILSTAGIVIRVINVLYDSRDSSSSHRDLMNELRALHRSLLAVNDVAQVQRQLNTALANNLICSVDQEVKGCHVIMHSFLENIHKYRQPLSSTGIKTLWGKLWWSLWEVDEVNALKSTLSAHTQRLTMLLTAFNSMTMTAVGDDVRTGNKTINDVVAIIKGAQMTPQDNPENMVWVVDIGHLTAKLESDSSNSLDWYELGRTYMVGRNFVLAYEAYQQAVYRDGRNAKIWTAVGSLYLQLNQPRDAIGAHTRAIRSNPLSPEAWYNLGKVYESTDQNYSDAIDAYQRGHELDPSNHLVAQRLIILLRSHPDKATHERSAPAFHVTPFDSPNSSYQALEESEDIFSGATGIAFGDEILDFGRVWMSDDKVEESKIQEVSESEETEHTTE